MFFCVLAASEFAIASSEEATLEWFVTVSFQVRHSAVIRQIDHRRSKHMVRIGFTILFMVLQVGAHLHEDAPKYQATRDLKAFTRAAENLPTLPRGVSELKFGEILEPIGRKGLAITEKAQALNGKRVRILGYMVRQSPPTAGRLLLAPFPVQLHDEEYGLADDLPASTVHVFVGVKSEQPVPFTPGLLLLTGRLEVGSREEADGRISIIRLHLDPQKNTFRPSLQRKGAENLRRSVH